MPVYVFYMLQRQNVFHLQKFSSLPQGVKEIKEKLGEYASYDEIRFVFEAYKKHIPA